MSDICIGSMCGLLFYHRPDGELWDIHILEYQNIILIFQEHIRKVISHIEPTKNISDDIIIYGKGENAQAMHDRAIAETIDALHTNGLTLNLDKCKVNMTSTEYYGMIFSKAGVSSDPKKVQALKELPPPSNVAKLSTFLGMMNYLSRFIKDFSTIGEPLIRLTKKDADWVWAFEQDAAFSSLKNLLVENACATYFDVKKATLLIVDASPTGLGSILIQDDRAIAFASRSLSDVESRYSVKLWVWYGHASTSTNTCKEIRSSQ